MYQIKPTAPLVHAPATLDTNRCDLLLLPEHLLANQNLNASPIVRVQNLVSLSLRKFHAVVLSVSLVDFKLSLHFSDLVIYFVLFFFFPLNPLLMLLHLETLESHRIVSERVVDVSAVDRVTDDCLAPIAGLFEQLHFQLQLFGVSAGVQSHHAAMLKSAFVVGTDLLADDFV